jgi:hypothetical protein
MRCPLTFLIAAAGLLPVAAGRAAEEAPAVAKKQISLPAGPLVEPLTPPEPSVIASVPEPVLTSILAASAVIFLRRARR